MAFKNSIKNIDEVLVDIRRPGIKRYERRSKIVNLTGIVAQPLIIYQPRKFNFLRFLVIFLIASAFLFYLFYFNFSVSKFVVKNEIKFILKNFEVVLNNLKNFNFEESLVLLEQNKNVLNNLKNNLDKYKIAQIDNLLSNFWFEANFVFNKFDLIYSFNENLIEIVNILKNLKSNSFYYLFNDGNLLIYNLDKLNNLFEKTSEILKDLQKNNNFVSADSELGKINESLKQKYFAYNLDFFQFNNFLANFLNFLKNNKEFYYLVFFQNPAEIRPSGGFIGSYAEIFVKNAKIEKIEVRDIYEPEGWLELNVIPPQPLMVTNYRWSARDANWFFDFPLSAEKVIYFLENSKIYSEKNINFKGAIALNINVLKNILKLTGPVYLKDFDLTINEDNFLIEIQREVEAGEFKKLNEPKKILKVLTPILIEKLNNFSTNQKEDLFKILLENIENKDLMIYFKDENLQKFFNQYYLAGNVYQLEDKFFGNYLAVVNANIEGGKSDAFIFQNIELEAAIDTKGNIFNTLIIKRTHNGNLQKDLWWKKTNQIYLQVFVNKESNLVSVNGNENMPKKFKEIDYTANNYQNDKDVYDFEKNNLFIRNYKTWVGDFYNKNVFGIWLKTKAGETSILEMRYETKPKFNLVLKDETIYNFIYQKQSGVETGLKIKIYAPYGYYFKESQAPFYLYEKDKVKGIEKFSLTLKRY